MKSSKHGTRREMSKGATRGKQSGSQWRKERSAEKVDNDEKRRVEDRSQRWENEAHNATIRASDRRCLISLISHRS